MEDLSESNDISIFSSISSIMMSLSVGLSLFGWYFYNNSNFRRNVIEKSFDSYDYMYNKYCNLRYDDKIRINNLLPKDFKNHSILAREDKLNNNILKLKNDYSTKESLIQDSLIQDDINIELLEFLSDDLRYEHITIKDKDYYILGSKNKNELQFSEDKILNMDWLAVSIEIELNNLLGESHSLVYDITSTFNKYWVLGNQIPFSIDYYDIWINNILNNSLSCLSSIPSIPRIEEIKNLKLVIIDSLGDFKEYDNILIIPRKDETRVIKLPSSIKVKTPSSILTFDTNASENF